MSGSTIVSSFAALNSAILTADSLTSGSYTISLSGAITETTDLEAINLKSGVSLVIQGGTLNGANAYEGLFVYQGNVTVENITFLDTEAKGGNGGNGPGGGGGGGAGLGGALFIAGNTEGANGGNVTISNVNFVGDSAVGGNGGTLTSGGGYDDGGGGGGLNGGNGGNGVVDRAGGGGGVGNAAAGGNPGTVGHAGIIAGAAGGGNGASGAAGGGAAGAAGGASGGGGGGGGTGNDYLGGGGGVGGQSSGKPGFGGGDGGSEFASGGGFGGGGGSYGYGGFGGGQGGNGRSAGFGGGAKASQDGGGGLGAGGDIFVMQGGHLTIESGTISAGTVAGGTGPGGSVSTGSGLGTSIFFEGNQYQTLTPASGQTITILGSIDDVYGSGGNSYNYGNGSSTGGGGGRAGLVLSGTGAVLLAGANSDYQGGTTIDSGPLILGAAHAAGSGGITFAGTTPQFLTFSTPDAPSNIITGFVMGDTIDVTDIPISSANVPLSYSSAKILVIPDSLAAGGTLDLTFAGTIPLGEGFLENPDGNGGDNITLNITNYTFTGTGAETNAADYAAGISPGGTLQSFATLTIAGAATVAGTLADLGITTIAAGATLADAGSISGTGTLAVGSGGLLNVTSGGTLALGGTLTDNGILAVASGGLLSGLINGTGTLAVAAGAQVTLTGGSIGTIADLGTVTVSGPLAGTINLEGTNAQTAVNFSGTSDSTPITNLGATDAIILGSSLLPIPGNGTGITLSYDTTAGVLTLTEGGTSTQVTVSGTAGSTLTSSSFITQYGPQGVYIELASTNFTFTGTGSETDATQYAGGIGPGNTILAADTLTIAGTATVAGTLADLGITTIAAGGTLADAGSITGTGTLAVGAGGLLSVTSGGTLALTGGTLTDNGLLAVASGGLLSGSINGTGTLAIAAGAQVTLTGGSIGTIADAGTVAITGQLAGIIDLQGNGANTVADFSGTSESTPIINLGTTDEIILGASIIPAPSTGTSLSLSYDSVAGTLAVTDTSSSGSVTTTYVTVSGVGPLDTADFVATEGPNGATIQLLQGFTFLAPGSAGSFVTAADYPSGPAPTNSLSPADQVTIAAGTANVATPLDDEGLVTIQNGATIYATSTLGGGGSLAIGAGGTLIIGNGGTLGLTGPLTNTGTIIVQAGGDATIATGTGGTILDQGTVDLTGSAAGTTVDLGGTIGSTLLDAGALTGGTFSASALATQFGAGDTIAIGGSNFTGSAGDPFIFGSYANGVLSFNDGTTGEIFNVTLSPAAAGTYTASDFTFSAVGGAVDITTDIPCFAAGTRILGIDGDMLVEDIQVGDELVTVLETGPATRKVVWTGKRAIDIARHPRPEMVRPVRIIAGAFGHNLPERDLRLSPLHAVYVNGCLFGAISLLNGTTIYQEQTTRYVTYHHIELEAHDVLLAEGLPAESFLDTGDKNMFESVSGVTVLHPDFATPGGEKFCAPMIRDGAELDQLRAALTTRIRKQA